MKACSVALGKTLKGADSGMVSFLEENGFITDEVRLRVIDVKTPLSAADKTNLLVEGIKDRIDLDEDSYKVLVDKFKLSGVFYGPIVKKLDKEYEKQYAAANPNTTRERACMCMYRKQRATCNVRIYIQQRLRPQMPVVVVVQLAILQLHSPTLQHLLRSLRVRYRITRSMLKSERASIVVINIPFDH